MLLKNMVGLKLKALFSDALARVKCFGDYKEQLIERILNKQKIRRSLRKWKRNKGIAKLVQKSQIVALRQVFGAFRKARAEKILQIQAFYERQSKLRTIYGLIKMVYFKRRF